MASVVQKYLLLATLARRPDAAGADLGTMSALIERHNDEQDSAWPSLSTIASDIGRDRRTVQRSLRRLLGWGFVVIVKRGGRTSSNRYRPCFELGVPLHMCRGVGAPTGRGVDAPTGRGVDAPTGRGVGAPVIHPTEPVRVRGGGGDTPDALPRAVAPAPEGIDPAAWGKLLMARPELDAADLAESVAYHQSQGCPAELLNAALDGLRLHRGHRSLSPAPYRRPKAPRAKPQAPAAPAPVRLTSAAGASIVRLVPAVEPLRALYRQRFGSNGNTHCAERERCAERLRREFPELADAITAKSNDVPFPFVSDGQRRKIAELLADEWSLVSARQKAKRDAFAARHAGASQ